MCSIYWAARSEETNSSCTGHAPRTYPPVHVFSNGTYSKGRNFHDGEHVWNCSGVQQLGWTLSDRQSAIPVKVVHQTVTIEHCVRTLVPISICPPSLTPTIAVEISVWDTATADTRHNFVSIIRAIVGTKAIRTFTALIGGANIVTALVCKISSPNHIEFRRVIFTAETGKLEVVHAAGLLLHVVQ